MKAVLMEGFGGVDVLKVGEAPQPQPAAGQVLIRVMATSINRPDLVQRGGKYPPPLGESDILGLEVAGVIEDIGPGAAGWKRVSALCPSWVEAGIPSTPWPMRTTPCASPTA